MSFRKLQDMQKFASGKIVYIYLQVNPDTGVSEPSDMDQCAKLPSVENFDLAAMLKAGIDLRQVNCKLVNGTQTVASLNDAMSKVASKSKKGSVDNGGSNNEQ